MKEIGRRKFLISASAVASTAIVSCSSDATTQSGTSTTENQLTQTFKAGYAPLAGMQSTEELFWQACDECSQLGFKYIETDNTRLQIVQTYADRPDEFKAKMDERGLTMVGFAQFSAMSDVDAKEQVIEENMQIGRLLQVAGGSYITHLFKARPNPGVPPEEVMSRMSDEEFEVFASTANELGRRLRDETGIRIGYHPERRDVQAGIFRRIMELTEPGSFDFFPDVGHLTAGGEDPLEVYRSYHTRMIGSHFKDYDPTIEWERRGETRKGRFVPLGQGVVDFPALAAYLKEVNFDGFVMGELDGQPESRKIMRDYMVDRLNFQL